MKPDWLRLFSRLQRIGESLRIPQVPLYQLMMGHACWEFPASAPHLDKLKTGDLLLFYLGGNTARYFAGESVVAGSRLQLSTSRRSRSRAR